MANLFPAFDNWIGNVQRDLDVGIKEAQQAIEGGANEAIGHFQNVGADATNAVLGKDTTKDLAEGGLLGGGMDIFGDIQGQMMGMGIGNMASAFGVDPKTLMIVGAAAVVGIVVLLVVLKT